MEIQSFSQLPAFPAKFTSVTRPNFDNVWFKQDDKIVNNLLNPSRLKNRVKKS